MTSTTQPSRRGRVSTCVAAAAIAVAGLGLGVSAGTASAAPQQPQRPPQTAPAQQHDVTVHRPDYRPFIYRGHRVTPRYDAVHRAWGLQDGRTSVRIILDRR